MIDETMADAEQRMSKAVDALRRELATIRTGRANPALVEHLRVDYYGTPTPLNQLASVTVPEARLLTIQPWDKNALEAIEKAIQKSDLGLNPSNDGSVIRLVIPQLTEERRRELVRVVHKKVEEGRVAVRNVRRDAHEMLRDLLREKEISEDEEHRAQEQLQKITNRFIGQADDVGEEKGQELLEV
ncbi:MAG: ribosome recycling factor [Chloroflexi bacterium RBG_16_68_14]|nr:MAG: ribosome recycling factor [Chloroflexi bacterium RBG_16_68_14]